MKAQLSPQLLPASGSQDDSAQLFADSEADGSECVAVRPVDPTVSLMRRLSSERSVRTRIDATLAILNGDLTIEQASDLLGVDSATISVWIERFMVLPWFPEERFPEGGLSGTTQPPATPPPSFES